MKDIDNDGDLDVIPYNGYILYNDGGKIDEFPRYGLYPIFSPKVEWVADLNGDGYPEMVSGGVTELTVYKNLQDFSQIRHSLGSYDIEPKIENAFEEIAIPFAYSPTEACSGGGTVKWHVKAVADLDNDGDKDVLTSCEDMDEMGALAWHENLGNDFSFASHLLVSDIYYLSQPQVVDFNGDGHQDILFGGVEAGALFRQNDGFVVWLRNDGNGNFTQSTLVSDINDDFRDSWNVQGRIGVLAADMDEDGDLDLITNTDGLVHGAEWWESDGENTPSLLDDHLIEIQSSMDRDEGLLGNFHVRDVDGDGDVDVIAI